MNNSEKGGTSEIVFNFYVIKNYWKLSTCRLLNFINHNIVSVQTQCHIS
jgi:hypothetical protein